MNRKLLILLALGCFACSADPAQADTAPTLAQLEDHAEKIGAQMDELSRAAARYSRWRKCLRQVGVSERGDPDGGDWGYQYDERDGTGVGLRSALTIWPIARAQYKFLALERRPGCKSLRTKPGGTADAARVKGSVLVGSKRQRIAKLEKLTAKIRRQSIRVELAAKKFDDWESCVSQIPVTQYGDREGVFGFLFGLPKLDGSPNYRSAISIDRSDWDDPDYLFFAFKHGDEPGDECDNDPGEDSD